MQNQGVLSRQVIGVQGHVECISNPGVCRAAPCFVQRRYPRSVRKLNRRCIGVRVPNRLVSGGNRGGWDAAAIGLMSSCARCRLAGAVSRCRMMWPSTLGVQGQTRRSIPGHKSKAWQTMHPTSAPCAPLGNALPTYSHWLQENSSQTAEL